jgi:hypothetical protein
MSEMTIPTILKVPGSTSRPNPDFVLYYLKFAYINVRYENKSLPSEKSIKYLAHDSI